MKVYDYNPRTFEYVCELEASINPVATKQEGKEVYFLPAHATFKQPPTVSEHKVVIFDVENDKWLVKDDYRNCYICDTLMNVLIVTEIGALPEGYIIITEGQAKQIIQDKLWYIVQDGELIKNPNYEQDKKRERKERIAKLAMTKYDFFKYVCQPYNIDYQTLLAVVNSNDEIAVAWNLCGHVFRGDATLTSNISKFIPEITEDILDDIYENHGKAINE